MPWARKKEWIQSSTGCQCIGTPSKSTGLTSVMKRLIALSLTFPYDTTASPYPELRELCEFRGVGSSYMKLRALGGIKCGRTLWAADAGPGLPPSVYAGTGPPPVAGACVSEGGVKKRTVNIMAQVGKGVLIGGGGNRTRASLMRWWGIVTRSVCGVIASCRPGSRSYIFEMKGLGITTRLGYGVMNGMKVVEGVMKVGVVINVGSSSTHAT